MCSVRTRSRISSSPCGRPDRRMVDISYNATTFRDGPTAV